MVPGGARCQVVLGGAHLAGLLGDPGGEGLDGGGDQGRPHPLPRLGQGAATRIALLGPGGAVGTMGQIGISDQKNLNKHQNLFF